MDLASIGLLTYGISALWLVFAIVVLLVLIRLYVQTRMSGFLWLLFAVVVWPFLSRAMSMAMPILIARQGLTSERMMTMTLGTAAVETLVGGILLVVAVVVLQREMTQQMLLGQQGFTGAQVGAGVPPYRG